MSPSCIKDAKEFSPENSKIELFVYQVTKKRVWVRSRRSQDGGRWGGEDDTNPGFNNYLS